MRPIVTLFSALLLLAGLLGLTGPNDARACGGLFCAAPTGPTPAEPVDQSAERIIFEVGGGEITAHVQIQYQGEPEGFAWVVPVPAVPDVEDSDVARFVGLDAFSRLDVQLPRPRSCPQSSSSGGFGCAASDDASATSAGSSAPTSDSTVTIFSHDFTDNYEFNVVGAENTADLVEWLQDNDYTVSDNMTPVMDVYNGGGMKFLAVKLRAGKTDSDIVPLAFTYPGDEPVIPLQLTAVAAQPLMGVLVMIVADDPFEPAAPFDAIDPDVDEILFDAVGNTSYFEWVARAAAEADGRLFVREYVGDNQASGLAGDLGQVVSRFYTRLNPHHMDADPRFVRRGLARRGGSKTLDFTARPTLWDCFGVISDRVPSPCAFNYCGLGAECTIEDSVASCTCAQGDVAQPLRGPDGLTHVTCIPEKNPYAVPSELADLGSVCPSGACGAGRCVSRGGFPSCQCDIGATAQLQSDGTVRCIAATGSQTFGPGGGSESAGAETLEPPSSQFAVPWVLPVLLLGVGLPMIRRRRVGR